MKLSKTITYYFRYLTYFLYKKIHIIPNISVDETVY